MIIRELSGAECAKLIADERLARLACASDGRPYIVPMFYAYADGCAYALTLPGRKLEIMRANPQVALLVERNDGGRCWSSVLAEGQFEELPDRIGHKHLRERAWSLLSVHVDWWEPGALKPASPSVSTRSTHVFLRIHIETMTGRQALDD